MRCNISVVWKNSTQLGVRVATSGKRVYVVGQYRPAGNMNTKEHFQQNVLPSGDTKVTTVFWNRPVGVGPFNTQHNVWVHGLMRTQTE